jgi:membrane-associated phospholipid phosphatase
MSSGATLGNESQSLVPNSIAETMEPGCASAAAKTRRAMLVTGLLFAISVAAFLVDHPLARWTLHPHYPAAIRKLYQLSEPFGHGIGVIVIGVLIFQVDVLRRWSVPRVLLISLGSGVLADIVKLIIARVRPRHLDLFSPNVADFSGFLPILGAGHTTQSFPSGHAAVAVGFGIALSWLYPRGRWIFAALAVLACWQRLDEGAHSLSDLLFGAALASLVGTLCLYWQPLASFFDAREAAWRKASRNSP